MKKLFSILLVILIYVSCNKQNIQKNCCKSSNVFEKVDSFSVFIPNIFTPNNDGENDILQIYAPNINHFSSVKIVIYNKKDEIIFESTDIMFKWDGKHTGGKWNGKTIEGHYRFIFDVVTAWGKNVHAESDVAVIVNPCDYKLKNLDNCAFGNQYDPTSSTGYTHAIYPQGDMAFVCK